MPECYQASLVALLFSLSGDFLLLWEPMNDKPEINDAHEERQVHTSLYGGQAIIEGVMMKGPERTVAAVRAPSGKIAHKILREGVDDDRIEL